MKILVQAKDMVVTPAIEQFVNHKVTRSVAKLGQRVLGVRVYLENIARKKNDPNGSTVKVKVELPGEDIVVEGRSHDSYAAIASAIKAATRRLRKLKDKRISKRSVIR
ncbi:MAG: ribosome-associated translation inhibitor RaiA [Candidatus Pacebacteria bacterium]|nr:ribosome-associated translation inhibitor RaiA [Candidatus Paceibacterota bacterium]